MPWRQQAMKDVLVCDKPRGVDKWTLIRGFPNGETRRTLKTLCALSVLRGQKTEDGRQMKARRAAALLKICQQFSVISLPSE